MTNPPVLDTEAAKLAILELEKKRYQAVLDGDLDAFRTYCHPRLVYTHSDGTRDSVDTYLDKVRAGFYVYRRIEHPAHDVVIVGDTAVVVGEMNADITTDGEAKRLANDSIAVWVRQEGVWLLLAYQPTPRSR